MGPYIYEAKHEKQIEDWRKNKNTEETGSDEAVITFQSRTVYQKVENSELGRDDDSDIIVVPNLVLMAGMLKPEVQQMPHFVKESAVWELLQSTGRGIPLLKLKVKEFLWGYEVRSCITKMQDALITNLGTKTNFKLICNIFAFMMLTLFLSFQDELACIVEGGKGADLQESDPFQADTPDDFDPFEETNGFMSDSLGYDAR